MEFKKPKNENYCATVVEIKNIVPLFTVKGEECKTIVGSSIFGNSVILGRDAKVGDIGVYFPAETKLSPDFLKYNNLYDKPELNHDTTKKGYISEKGRIRAIKLQGNPSNGLFMPLVSVMITLAYVGKLSFDITTDSFKVGDTFDEINDVPICEKYIVIPQYVKGERNKNMRKVARVSRLLDDQFRFHIKETKHLGKFIHLLSPKRLVSYTYKIHGTSAVFSKVLVKKKLSWYQRFLQKLGADIVTYEYDNLYASRKVIKNEFSLTEKVQNHFYKTDVWKDANEIIKEYLTNGLTLYCEIAGFTKTGEIIQSFKKVPFDYGCKDNEFRIYIYRITYTNLNGDVYEFSAKQVQNWCKERGLVDGKITVVPELYYGTIEQYYPYFDGSDIELWKIELLKQMKKDFNEKDCYICRNKLPEEGVVVRFDDVNFVDVYKLKSFRFVHGETEENDKGEINIEDIS